MTPPGVQTRFTRGRVRELKNGHNPVTVQNRTHVYMNFFHHKGLGNHLLQLCPKVVKHPVYIYIYIHTEDGQNNGHTRQYRDKRVCVDYTERPLVVSFVVLFLVDTVYAM